MRDEKAVRLVRGGKWLQTRGLRREGSKKVTKNRGPLAVLGVSRGSPRLCRRCAARRGLNSGTFWHIVAHHVPKVHAPSEWRPIRSRRTCTAPKNIGPSVLPAALRERRSGRAMVSRIHDSPRESMENISGVARAQRNRLREVPGRGRKTATNFRKLGGSGFGKLALISLEVHIAGRRGVGWARIR
jgi:hypothetical protein